MMYLYIYLIGECENIKAWLCISAFLVTALLVVYSMYCEDFHKPFNNTLKRFAISWVVLSVILCTFLPNRSTLISMAAYKYGKDIYHNPRLNNIIHKSFELVEKKIEKSINDF